MNHFFFLVQTKDRSPSLNIVHTDCLKERGRSRIKYIRMPRVFNGIKLCTTTYIYIYTHEGVGWGLVGRERERE